MVQRGHKWVTEASASDPEAIEWATKEAVQETIDRINKGTPWRVVSAVFVTEPKPQMVEQGLL